MVIALTICAALALVAWFLNTSQHNRDTAILGLNAIAAIGALVFVVFFAALFIALL